MQTLCAHLRKRIDACDLRHVNLSVEEIQIRAPRGTGGAETLAWWHDVFRDPANPIHVALSQNHLDCILITDCGRVTSVEFFRAPPSKPIE
jgi:hypothetical protein